MKPHVLKIRMMFAILGTGTGKLSHCSGWFRAQSLNLLRRGGHSGLRRWQLYGDCSTFYAQPKDVIARNACLEQDRSLILDPQGHNQSIHASPS